MGKGRVMGRKAGPASSRISNPAPLFASQEDGAATIFVVVMFTLMVAFTGMVIDVGRILNIHSQASSYVDRVALAAAAELDAESGAMQRSVRAGVGDAADGPIIPQGFRFSLSGDNAVNVSRMVFMSAIADDPADPYARSPLAGDTVLCEWTSGAGFDCGASGLTVAEADLEAAFVLVDATTETENYIMFPIAAALSPGLATDASVAPQAVAGFNQEVCNAPPLAICNPYENPGGGGDFTPVVGQQILLKTKGSGASWAPGNFGLLQMQSDAGGNLCNGAPGSAAFIRCVLSLQNPNTRCISTRVSTAPGEKNTIHNGLNVRFDIYDPPLSRNDPNTPPSANVAKGKYFNGNQCQTNKLQEHPEGDAAHTEALPRDPCFATDTCAGASGDPRFGDGISSAELTAYWQANHGQATLPLDFNGTTRYDLYRYEIDKPDMTDKSGITGGNGDKGENGAPTCSAATPVNNPIRDRRVLIVAVMNCIEHGVAGNSPDVPVIDFMEVFLTEPIGAEASNEDDIWGEVQGVVNPGADDGVLHEFPVLYR